MTALKDLEKRLEEATTGSRELDSKIASIFSHDVESDDGDWWWGPYNEPPVRVPDFSTSLDAAVSLCERVLPGWAMLVRTEDHRENGWLANVWQTWGPRDGLRYEAICCKTPALALCLATVRALISKGGEGE